jgi:thioredoxin reductase
MTYDVTKTYDVIVAGGGPAGLSGAVALARALRSVLVVDAGEPRNAPAEGIHNYLTRDSISPVEFAAAGRAEVRRYGGEVVDGRVVAAVRRDDVFVVSLADGAELRARRLLLTTGLTDHLPDIPGLRERWGRTVLHCPYCHGYEVRGQAIGIIGTSPMAVEQALHWRQWSPDVTLFLHAEDPADDPADDPRLAARGITVVGEAVRSIGDDGVHLADGSVVARDAYVVHARLVVEPLPGLGLEMTESPQGVAVATVDPTGRTSVPGVWAAGNAADLMGQVITSAGAGLLAGAAINVDLMTEDTDRAVADYRPVASSR